MIYKIEFAMTFMSQIVLGLIAFTLTFGSVEGVLLSIRSVLSVASR